MHFKTQNPEMEGVIENSIKVFLLTCLYILYVDMNMAGVRILSQTINKDTGRAYIDREISYRTAHIRKLQTGYNPSEEAKAGAKKMGIMLPKGYTFIRESIASGEKARRVAKVRAV